MKRILAGIAAIASIVILLPVVILKGCGAGPRYTVPETAKTVKVWMCDIKKTADLPLEEYVKCVVAAEMPAGYSKEALKAQAVAARTYAWARHLGLYRSADGLHPDADVCTDPAHCQAYTVKSRAMAKWGIINAVRYWKKVSDAVNSTKGVILVYRGQIINPLFHSNSGGKTENADDVWDTRPVPYLASVSSPGEDTYPGFRSEKTISVSDFSKLFKAAYPDVLYDANDSSGDIKILTHTKGGSVKDMRIGNIIISGVRFRSLFSIRSAKFAVEPPEGGMLRITAEGYGHGVGMSQCGADYMAKKGAKYEEILKHYYTGVSLDMIGGTD